MDIIDLTGIRVYGYTGYLPEERSLGQWFEVDLKLWLDLAPAGTSDDIAHTLDYRKAIAAVRELVKTARFNLVEKLASAIADTVLEFELVEQVGVRLSKPAAPIPDFGGTITVEILRQRVQANTSSFQGG
ncbi:dihydroneopterin aldolase [Rubidibacter lacunae KORDI 51-2]|uniref:7,8-dihydroneopterin aldolase n=1 Tax=Rubidibacter lacunae KORDI 51-2 TaxID=582515 RepID=U5DR03_9CHRO|nr:dihydroneopterin aldolase [Rubidibacter lacunae]ERN42095.1 dihydroneopterin aldolase [Rubidibacter lacunae KORDI 51-2]